MKPVSDLRPSPIAGTWYSADPTRLRNQVDGFLREAVLPEMHGEVIAVIAPHAGHRYSGAVAGYAFKAVMELNPDLVAVISPMHQPYMQPLLTTAHRGYQTPLGAIPVDLTAVDKLDAALKADLGFGLTAIANDDEHSLEIELPFLQRAFSQPFHLLPVMVREQTPPVAKSLGKALAKTLSGKKALLVASTDLSHFYPQRVAEMMDSEMLRQIADFSPEGVFNADSLGSGYACGLGALAAVMWAARELGADEVKMLKRATSGDVTGDYSSVVGYGAAAILKTAAQ